MREDFMNGKNESLRQMTRRHFFRQTGFGIGALALSSLLDQNLFALQDTRPGKRDTT